MTALDFERVREAAGDDPEFIQELMDLFVEDTGERIKELRTALAAGANDEVARCAHKLKGSSANVGALGITRCAKSLEEMGKNGQLDGAADLIDQAERDLGSINSEVASLLSSL